MDVRSRTRPDLDSLQPTVLTEIDRNPDVLIWNRTSCGNVIRLCHRQNHIRLADRPTFGEMRTRRKIRVISLLRTAVHPGDDHIDVALREPRIVSKMADRRIRAPGRHLTREDTLLDRSCPRTRVFVRQ